MPTLIRTRPTLEVSVDFAANPTASYADIHETDDGVVSFWRCNSSSTFLDEVGTNDGVIVGTPTTTAGPFAYDSNLALAFDGSADSAYVVTSTDLTSGSDFTVDGWIKLPSLPGSTKDLIAKRGSWLIQANSSGKLLFTVKDDTSTATVTSNSTLSTGTYYYVACVYDSVNIYIYINGVLDNSTAYTSGWERGPQPIRFGGAPTTSPTWQSSSTNVGTSFTPTGTLPASTANGDLLVAHMHLSTGTTASPTITAVPSGWTLWTNAITDGRAQEYGTSVYYKVAASEPASWAWTANVNCTWIVAVSRISGQSTVAPLANAPYGVLTSVSPHSTGTHVPNVDNNLILAMFSCDQNANWTQSSGTERYDLNTGSNSLCGCTQTQATAASLAVTGTPSASDNGAAYLMVIAGAAVDETEVTVDDVAFSNVAMDESDIVRNYLSKDSGTPTWTAVTAEVRELEASSAERRHELDVLAAGKMGMTLREVDDKDFDPGNTSSPYLPDVEQRVRVRATWNSTTYDVFRGYADRWTPTRLGGADVEEVQFEATDGFDLLALAPVVGTFPVGFSGEHINAILSKALWPLDDRDIDTGQYAMNGYTIGEGGTSALALLQEIAGSERGLCFIDAAGVFHFHDAAHRGSESRSTTSQATFCDYIANIVTSTDIRYQWIQPTRDKDKIVNIWTVSPDSGVFAAADQTMTDHLSVARYGPRGQSRSTKLASNADALDQAGNLLTETAFPADRYESMKVIPLTTESYATCLDLRISDRVTVKRGFNPGWDGATMTRDYFVEGKTVNIADKTAAWEFTFVLSPVSSGNYYATIMRDGPVSYWRMDSIT